MKMFHKTWPALVGWLAVISGGSFAAPPRCLADPDRPNVILVMADDMGWAQTGYRNHPILETPAIDAMSDSGIRFDRFYAAAPVCSPTRASVLTGRSNDRTGVLSHGYALRRQETTLAQLLKKAGYTTGHFGKWHLNGLRGPGVPVLHTDSHHPGHFGFDQWLSVTNYFDRDPLLSDRGRFVEFEGDSSEVVVDEAMKFVARQAKAGQPFLAVIWYGSPHDPFVAADRDVTEFEELDETSKQHYGELVAMDRSLGTLRKGLRELSIADDTLLWFCSDNGGLGNIRPSAVAPLRGSKGTIYEGGLLVPAVLEWPDRIKSPAVVDSRAGTVDILPTVLDALALNELIPERPLDGVSLMPVIEQVIAGETPAGRTRPLHFRHEGRLAVIEGDMKLLTTDIRTGKFELYDLANDLSETNDLVGERPEDAKRLMKELIDWNQTVQQSIAGMDYPDRRINPGEPQSQFWHTRPEYQTFLEAWKQRPEYARWFNRRAARQRP